MTDWKWNLFLLVLGVVAVVGVLAVIRAVMRKSLKGLARVSTYLDSGGLEALVRVVEPATSMPTTRFGRLAELLDSGGLSLLVRPEPPLRVQERGSDPHV